MCCRPNEGETADQSSVSHDPSEIILIWWFGAQETFLIIFNVGTVSFFITKYNMLLNIQQSDE